MIDYSRVVLLTSVTREKGQVFLPSAAAALLARYQFQGVPSQAEMLGDTIIFKHGHFQDVGINELGLYNDGMVITSRANTDYLDVLLSDILEWADAELGIKETGIPPREKHYESSVIVSMSIIANKVAPELEYTTRSLTNFQESYGLRSFGFDFGGISIAPDATAYTGRKPVAFTLARRINVPFDSGIFYSTAPLRTQDHLALLNGLEERLA